MIVEWDRMPSETNPNMEYLITIVDGTAVACGCPSYQFNADREGANMCKHIRLWNSREEEEQPTQ